MSRILMPDGTVLIEKLILAESLRSRMKGLLGYASLDARTGMLIRPCKSIHMWFMQFPIDVAFLDAEMNVLKIVQHLRPWKMAFAPRKTYCVLETASGQLQNLQQGDKLIIG